MKFMMVVFGKSEWEWQRGGGRWMDVRRAISKPKMWGPSWIVPTGRQERSQKQRERGVGSSSHNSLAAYSGFEFSENGDRGNSICDKVRVQRASIVWCLFQDLNIIAQQDQARRPTSGWKIKIPILCPSSFHAWVTPILLSGLITSCASLGDICALHLGEKYREYLSLTTMDFSSFLLDT